MKAFNDLISTDYGLMSLGVILFCVVMGGYIYNFAKKKMAEDARAAGQK